jgi:hypothetical protein
MARRSLATAAPKRSSVSRFGCGDVWNADNGVEALAIEDFAAGHVMSELDFRDGRTAARPGRTPLHIPQGDALGGSNDLMAKCPPALGWQMFAHASDARKAASEVARQMPIREAFL